MNTYVFYFLKHNRGFSLTQLMIGMLIFSALGLKMTSYMRKNQANLNSADISADIGDTGSLVQKMITDDIRQVAYVHPGCLDATYGASPPSATAPCSSIQVRGGVTPIPGAYQSDMDATTNTLGLPSNISADPSTLTKDYDGVRLVQFNFSGAFNCKLNPYVSTNPTTSSGHGSGAQQLYALHNGCTGNLSVNGLYLLMESITVSSAQVVYSNVFQITALSDSYSGVNTSPSQITIDARSVSGNIFNQDGGLGLSGFSSHARIYPIKLVEWGVQPGSGLYRREIVPTSTSVNGYTSWNLVSDLVEGIQFFPVTVTTSSVTVHSRTMNFTNDSNNNGVHAIRGLSPYLVIKSAKASSDGNLYDNPLTAVVESDHFPRKEMKFFVDIENTHTD